jgi:uncharacterized membrane protein
METAWQDKAVVAVSALAVGLVVAGIFAAMLVPRVGERFTEFYVLQADGQVDEDLVRIRKGEPVSLVVGVSNLEGRDVRYRVEWRGAREAGQLAEFELEHEGTWEQSFSFDVGETAERQRIALSLYREDDAAPYRSLYLWVGESSSAPEIVASETGS